MRSFSASAFGAVIAVIAVCLSGCGGCGDSDPWTVEPVEDAAAVEELAFVPLHELVRAVPADTAAAVEWFVGHTGAFGADYVETILRLGPVDAGATYVAMQEFAAHPDIAESFRAIDTTSAVAAREAEPALRAAFGRFARHFPSDTLPAVVWMNTAFNVAVYPTATHLGVGLDWFLGPEHPIVGMLAPEVFPAYQRARMDPQYLVSDALRGWMLVHFASNWYDPRTCADEALYRGKIFFMLHRIHPDAASRLSVMTLWRRCGSVLYTLSSTNFGSTIKKRRVRGVCRYTRLVMIVFTQTDLPEPVVPAISRWGILARSAI
jgi:hypothetical protein